MVLCFIALFVFGFLGIFSAKYRPLAKEALECFWTTMQFKPCQGTLEDRLRRGILSQTFKVSPNLTKYVNRYFYLLSWLFVLLFFGSLAYSMVSVYNFYLYGNCNGPGQKGFCIFDPLASGDGKSCPANLGDRPNPKYPSNLGTHILGQMDAKVTLLEIGCYTCPYTKEAQPAVDEILNEYIRNKVAGNPRIRFVFKPFPLPGHPFSSETAQAAECAADQGKYWEYQKLLFKEQESIANGGLDRLAALGTQIGLNGLDLKTCIGTGKHNQTIQKYFDEGVENGVYGTPTFFVNGKFLAVGPMTIEELSKAINAELAK
ncbi:MAG: thioredoxin domain-containing protein [Candidatus Micrarchaeota archaeon]